MEATNIKEKRMKARRYRLSQKTIKYILGEVYFNFLFESFEKQKPQGKKDFVFWFRKLLEGKIISFKELK